MNKAQKIIWTGLIIAIYIQSHTGTIKEFALTFTVALILHFIWSDKHGKKKS